LICANLRFLWMSIFPGRGRPYMVQVEVFQQTQSLGVATLRVVARKDLDATLVQIEAAALNCRVDTPGRSVSGGIHSTV